MSSFSRVYFATLLTVFVAPSAYAFHGFSFELAAGERSVSIYFDPSLDSPAAWEYAANPSELMADLVNLAAANQQEIASLAEDYQVFLSLNEEVWTYVVETVEGGSATAIREFSNAAVPREVLLADILCAEPIALTCETPTEDPDVIVVDGSAGDEAREALPEPDFGGPAALVSFGPMGMPAQDGLRVISVSEIPNAESIATVDGVRVGPARETLSGFRALFDPTDAKDPPQEVPEGPEERGDFPAIDRTNFPNGDDLDPRLQFIVLHCTAGNMSPAAVRALRGKRGRGHIYVMPNGDLEKLWEPTENPNHVLATKTELQRCTGTRARAYRTMYHIELNYACHWRTSQSPDPSEAQMASAAKHIADLFNSFGPFHILAHTYIDMGINSRYAHTDPQGSGGFDYEDLYSRIESHGVDLSNVIKIEQNFADQYPVSQRHIQHSFPPVVNQTLPSSGTDDCMWPDQ